MTIRDFLFGPRAGSEKELPPVPRELTGALPALNRLAAERPELAPASRTLAAALRAVYEVTDPPEDAPPHADPEVLEAAWRAGVPAVRAGDAPPTIDAATLARRAVSLCRALGPTNPNAAALGAAIGDGRADLHAWSLAALADPGWSPDGPTALGLDPLLTRSVMRLALFPTLSRLSSRLAAGRPEGVWTRGECPTCGSPPTLAESRGLEQRRYLRCGVCADDWPGERLRCPFCGETDHRRLHYRFVEGEQERYRLSLCDACGGSLPLVATLTPLSAPALLVAELATAHLAALDGP